MRMEQPRRGIEKINDEFRRAGNYGRRKDEDLAFKEAITGVKEILEGEDKKSVKILSPEASGKIAGELVKKLEERDKKNFKS
jgi:hypothetical protein